MHSKVPCQCLLEQVMITCDRIYESKWPRLHYKSPGTGQMYKSLSSMRIDKMNVLWLRVVCALSSAGYTRPIEEQPCTFLCVAPLFFQVLRVLAEMFLGSTTFVNFTFNSTLYYFWLSRHNIRSIICLICVEAFICVLVKF